MSKERLTDNNKELIKCSGYTCEEICHIHPHTCTDCPIEQGIIKLAEYEELEEQGLLLRLPCKVGDFIYYPSSYHNVVISVRVDEITISFMGTDNFSFQYNCCSFDECGDVYDEYEFDNSDIGKTVFLTQSEAEEKLKELEKENGK